MALRHPREVYVPTGEQSARRHRRRDLPSEISTHPNDHVKLHATLRLVPEWSNKSAAWEAVGFEHLRHRQRQGAGRGWQWASLSLGSAEPAIAQ